MCRTHFCHLPGLGQVGHFPRVTSGRAGTLDWGPKWLGSQYTCHPNAPLTSPTPHASPQCPLKSLYHLKFPESPTPCQPLMPSDTPTPPDTPDSLHPLSAPNVLTPLLAPIPLTFLHPCYPMPPRSPTVHAGLSAPCGSGCCFVTCTPPSLIPPPCPQGEASGSQEW